MQAMGPAICIAIAFGLQAPPLVIFASAAVGIAAVQAGGGPAGCYIAALLAVEAGKIVSKETKVDIIVTPTVTLLTGVACAVFVGPYIGSFMKWLGSVIESATLLQPFPMGIAVISFRDNGVSGLVAQGLGTSMLQVPNIVRNPLILIPPTLAAAILGPVATILLPMQNIPEGAGMGSCGLVGQIGTISAMGLDAWVLIKIALLHFIFPAVISLAIAKIMQVKGLIKLGDMKLNEG